VDQSCPRDYSGHLPATSTVISPDTRVPYRADYDLSTSGCKRASIQKPRQPPCRGNQARTPHVEAATYTLGAIYWHGSGESRRDSFSSLPRFPDHLLGASQDSLSAGTRKAPNAPASAEGQAGFISVDPWAVLRARRELAEGTASAVNKR
jgi:hypothetical protein